MGEKEKGTASFSESPIEMLENDVCFLDYGKNRLMVFLKSELIKAGVEKAKYVPIDELQDVYINDYMYADEDAEHEQEWRSVDNVDIRKAWVTTIDLIEQ